MKSRSQQHHYQRLGEALREEIASILGGELQDPRVIPVTVTDVQVAPGGKNAHVLVSISGDEREVRDAMLGLVSAKGYMRRELTLRLGLRRAPELIFQLDKSEQYGTRIEHLLRRVKKRKKQEGGD